MSQIPHQEQSPAPREEQKQEEKQGNKRNESGGAPVFVYLALMLAAAFLLLLMAYLVQEHTSQTVIEELQESLNLSRDALTEQNDLLRKEVEGLLGQVDSLQEQLHTSESNYLALEQENRQLLAAQQAVLTLERLEALVANEEIEAAQSIIDQQGETLRETLNWAEGQLTHPEGRPTLNQRYDAVIAALTPVEPENGTETEAPQE